MAKKDLNKDLKLIVTDKEEGNIPYFIIDKDFGASCDERNEMLVERKMANRVVKDENGNETHIEQYYKWDIIAYLKTFTDVLECYVNKKGKRERNRLNKATEFSEILSIYKDTNSLIKQSLQCDGLNKEFLDVGSVINERAKLEEEIQALRETREQITKEIDSLMKLIKEKRAIIISNTEPKKRRIKEENGDA